MRMRLAAESHLIVTRMRIVYFANVCLHAGDDIGADRPVSSKISYVLLSICRKLLFLHYTQIFPQTKAFFYP